MDRVEFLVLGSGIAGASAAYELSKSAQVVVAERESAHGVHTTGRSAALYSAAYGNAVIRALTLASRAFYDAPPEGFADYPLLTPRGCLYIATKGQEEALARVEAAAAESGVAMRRLDGASARALCPILREDYLTAAVFEAEAMDIDVQALHQGFLRGTRAHGGEIRLEAEATGLERADGGWAVRFADGSEMLAAVVIDAAGAWADVVAGLAGVAPIGLTPKRRTALILEAPDGVTPGPWPAVIDADEQFYFKPEAGRILASPADETPSEPCDAQPEEWDIAVCVDRVQQAADLPVRRVLRSWAGLRSFVADRSPVIGFDDAAPGFFWLAGQGGYGVQTAPAAGQVAAALALGLDVPRDVARFGVTAAMLAPGRLR
ncbi:MAG TPA: FAD-binding oxidoreductase [Caulobacteraceae bacterium]